MTRRRRHNRGEPLELEHDERLRVAMTPVDVRQVLADIATIGRIGAVLAPPPARPRSDVIEMKEVAPGVFARADNPQPRRRRPAPGPLGRLQQLERTLHRLVREVR